MENSWLTTDGDGTPTPYPGQDVPLLLLVPDPLDEGNCPKPIFVIGRYTKTRKYITQEGLPVEPSHWQHCKVPE